MKKQILFLGIILLALMPMRADAKEDPVAYFKVGGQEATGPTEQYLNDADNESVQLVFYTPVSTSEGTLHKNVPLNEITFNCPSPSVAYMDAKGKLQLVGKGSTTISASWPGNEEWNPANAEIKVIVYDPLYLRVAGKKVNDENKNDILGDGKAVYDSKNHTLTLHSVNWDFTDHNINAKYGVIEYWGPSDSLVILLDGINTFTNTSIGINTSTHLRGVNDMGKNELYIRSINNGVLRCSGDNSQICVDDWLYFEGGANIQIACDSRQATAVKAGGMGVDDGCQVIISSEGVGGKAVDIPFLYMDEHVHLQEGCQFIQKMNNNDPYGFFYDNDEVAWMVAILSEKIGGYGEPETPDNDKETNINLGESSSETAEDIAMISLGENDKYDNEKKQLEISTTLSDEEVEDALGLFGPGASALKYMLPGSISFFIPAGKGSIQIECQTWLGPLKVKLEGLSAVALSQAVMGWAKVDYDVAVDTYVVIYLSSKLMAPARMPAIQADDDPVAGAYIKGIKVVPVSTPTAIESVNQESDIHCQKVLENGQMIIIKNGVKYNAQGANVK